MTANLTGLGFKMAAVATQLKKNRHYTLFLLNRGRGIRKKR